MGSRLHKNRRITEDDRATRIARAAAVATVAAVIALACCAASFISIWFVLVGTGAEAIVAAASFYAAFEGFDERIRRRP